MFPIIFEHGENLNIFSLNGALWFTSIAYTSYKSEVVFAFQLILSNRKPHLVLIDNILTKYYKDGRCIYGGIIRWSSERQINLLEEVNVNSVMFFDGKKFAILDVCREVNSKRKYSISSKR